jgi:endonuclease/exonuclease/phosphatase family metal-dependent hydrolase
MQDTEARGISIMTFNILFENPIDYFKQNINSWNNRRDHVCNLLKNYNTDLICLQECTFNQLIYINKFLEDEYSLFGAVDKNLHWSDVNPILYKTKIFKFIKGGTNWLSETPLIQGSVSYGNKIPRTFKWALLERIETGDKVLVLSIHLDVIVEDSRTRSINQISEFIKNFEEEYDVVFLAGDFNESKEHEIFAVLESLNFQDSINWALEMRGTFNNFMKNYGWRIDYIFYLDKKGILGSGKYNVIEDKIPQGSFISDHFPVMIQFENKK